MTEGRNEVNDVRRSQGEIFFFFKKSFTTEELHRKCIKALCVVERQPTSITIIHFFLDTNHIFNYHHYIHKKQVRASKNKET